MDIMQYLDLRLNEWADWSIRKTDFGLGYPRKSIEGKLIDSGGVLIKCTGNYTPYSQPKAEEIEQYICILAKQNQLIADCLRVKYLFECNMQQKAKKLQISVTQFKTNVNLAKQWLAGRLSN